MASQKLGIDEIEVIMDFLAVPPSLDPAFRIYYLDFESPRLSESSRAALLQLSLVSRELRKMALERLARYIELESANFNALFGKQSSGVTAKLAISNTRSLALTKLPGKNKLLNRIGGLALELFRSLRGLSISMSPNDENFRTNNPFQSYQVPLAGLTYLILGDIYFPFSDFVVIALKMPRLTHLTIEALMVDNDGWNGDPDFTPLTLSPVPFTLTYLQLELPMHGAPYLGWLLGNSRGHCAIWTYTSSNLGIVMNYARS